MQSEGSNSKAKIVTGIIVIAAVALIYYFSSGKVHTAANTSSVSDQPLASTSQSSGSASSSGSSNSSGSMMGSSSGQMGSGMMYKAGTYNASEQYRTPESYEDINVSLAVGNDGTVTDASVSQSATNRQSAAYQESFKSEYKQYVVGKKLSDINLEYVSGSSLTSRAFDQAVSQIANQAKT